MRAGRRELQPWLATVAVALPLLWLVVIPLAILLASAFKPTGFLLDPGFTLDNLRQTWSDPQLWRLIGRTLQFAVGAASLALVLGTTLAWIVERTDFTGGAIVRSLIILPMAMPPFLLAIGWILLASPRTGALNLMLRDAFGLASSPFDIYSMAGMIFVEGLALTPSAYLIIAPALANFDAALEEAAQMSGAGTRVLLGRVVLPLMLPALAGAGIYLLIASCMVFDIPGTIGMPGGIMLLSTHMYDLVHNNPTGLPDYGAMSAVAILVIAVLIVLCLVYQRLTSDSGRYVTVTGKSFRPRPFALGRLAPFATGFVALYLIVSVVLPLGILVWASLLPFLMPMSFAALSRLTLANHLAFLADPAAGKALWHTLVIGLVAASLVAVITLVVSWTVVRTRAPGRRILDLIAFMPLAMPGVLIGTALIYVYLTVRIAPIYGSIWIIAIAHVTVYLSFASRAMNAAAAQLEAQIEEAARMSGAGALTTLWRIVVPLVLPAIGAVWLWVFSHSARELSSALMLQGADNKTVPTLLFSYWSQGQPTKTAAVGVWLAAGMFALFSATHLVQRLVSRRHQS